MASYQHDYHLIVIGAGPAGSALTIMAAKAGLSVLVLEKSAFPRHRPGESLHPGVEPLLRQLGVWEKVQNAGFVRNPGVRNAWGGQEQFAAFGKTGDDSWKGIQAVRCTFDALLLEEALQYPKVTYKNVKAIAPLMEGDHVIGVQTQSGKVYSKYVLDATGSSQWLARRLDLPIRTCSPRLMAYYGYATGNCKEVGESPWLRSAQDGWLWLAKLGAARYTWTYLPFADQPVPKDWMPDTYASLQPEGPVRSSDVTWRMATSSAGPGYFLLGDAAFVLDPTSSHGVLKAIMSGIKVAYLIEHIRKGSIPAHHAAALYHQWMEEWFNKEVETLKGLYRELAHPPIWVKEAENDKAIYN